MPTGCPGSWRPPARRRLPRSGASVPPRRRRSPAPGGGSLSGLRGTAAGATLRRRAPPRRRTAGAGTQALRSPRGADPGGQGTGGEAGSLVRRGGPLAGQRAQHGLVLGVARVQGAEVGGHHPAQADRAGVPVDGGLHDLFVQAGLMGSAAQGVGEVAAGFGEQVVARGRRRASRTPRRRRRRRPALCRPPAALVPTRPRPPPAPARRAGRWCRRRTP